MISCGLDSGSKTSKIVLFEDNKIIYSQVINTGITPLKTADILLRNALNQCNVININHIPVVVTGYGRNLIGDNRKIISEISCHAKGVNYFFPQAEIIIDIGGQDSKGICIGSGGKVLDFVMNDRCAAGTGRFLEKAADILEVDIAELGNLAMKVIKKLNISSTCVVFAESEMIGLIAQGNSASDIADSVHRSIAARIAGMIATFPKKSSIVFTGGVALNCAMVNCLQNECGVPVKVPSNPFITGALGAAIFAAEHHDARK